MKRTYFSTSLIVFMMLSIVAGFNGCSGKDEEPEVETLENACLDVPLDSVWILPVPARTFAELNQTYWKLSGFESCETGEVTVPSPIECADCFTLFFAYDISNYGNNLIFLGKNIVSTGNINIYDTSYKYNHGSYSELNADGELFRSLVEIQLVRV
ncbi:MAG: hypothetical protein LBS80_00650 [Tannerella sp.]|nr:hypothetical protein [Tannerella sp.]